MTETRYAIHPDDFRRYDTTQIRNSFLIDSLFRSDEIVQVYTHYDRLIVGGVKPVKTSIKLSSIDELKAAFYLERREMGIINVGAPSTIIVDNTSFEVGYKEALYIGQGSKNVSFEPARNGEALFYFNSAPAHTSYPTRKISHAEAETAEIGSIETSNQRVIRKLIVASVVKTCQLQMGLTELKKGSVWNTMPPHTHSRRMEAYFYFEIPEGQAVCHFLGQPAEIRNIWMNNNQAVLSPPWSIHSGAGTSNYSFIWGMAGENMDYGDMDTVKPDQLR